MPDAMPDKPHIAWFTRAPHDAADVAQTGPPRSAGPTLAAGTHRATLLKLAAGVAVGALLYAAGHAALALAAWAAGGALAVVALASARAAAALARAFAAFGQAVGSLVGMVLLGAVFFLVMTPARGLRRLWGVDELQLRPSDARSFWLECAPEAAKRRHVRAMFAIERRRPRRTAVASALGPALLALLVVAAIAEILLRTQGFGPGAILYVAHPRVGYYPAPDQRQVRYGGQVQTNHHGMRAPDFAPVKPPGTFRILMLGDSTLWGGSYIDQPQLYARLLEARLNQAAGAGRRVEVLNMGVNGWGPFHKSGFVETFGTFGADLVLVCLPHNDVDRDRYGLMSVPFFHAGTPPLLALEEVLMHTAWRYRRQRIVFGPEWLQAQRLLGEREYERLALLLRDGPAEGGGGAEVFMEVLPSRRVGLGGEAEPIERQVVGQLMARMQGLGIPAHYPQGLFKDRGPVDELYHDEEHLHWRGHAVYAAYLAERIGADSGRFKAWRAAPAFTPTTSP